MYIRLRSAKQPCFYISSIEHFSRKHVQTRINRSGVDINSNANILFVVVHEQPRARAIRFRPLGHVQKKYPPNRHLVWT